MKGEKEEEEEEEQELWIQRRKKIGKGKSGVRKPFTKRQQ